MQLSPNMSPSSRINPPHCIGSDNLQQPASLLSLTHSRCSRRSTRVGLFRQTDFCLRLSGFQHSSRHCLPAGPGFVRASSMAVSQQKALAMAGVCTLLLLTFLASNVNAACSIAQLNQCTAAVTRGYAPTGACCAQVNGINDFNCFCNMLLSQRNVPQNMINNAVQVPMKCGALGQKLRNRQCGNVHIP